MSLDNDLESKPGYLGVHCSAKSIASSTSTLYTSNDDSSFTPTRRLTIDAHGIGVFRFPSPSNELEIPVYTESDKVVYISKREKRSSGNCVLWSAKAGKLVETEYFFGMNRDPVLRVVDVEGKGGVEVKTRTKWMSRRMEVEVPDGRRVEWGYEKEKTADGRQVNFIVLREVVDKGEGGRGMEISRLIRSDETRTPGSSRCSVGNGRELLIDGSVLEFSSLDDGLVVASCLVMLKREVDRRRMKQAMTIGAIVAS